MTFEEIRKLVTPDYISAYYEANPREKGPYLGELLFPNRKQTGVMLDTIGGRRKAPVKLSASAYDVQAIKLTRGSFEIKQGKIPFFKNILSVDETLISKMQIIDRLNSAEVERVLEAIYADQASLLDDARLTREILRMQALCTGIVSIADNGQSYTFDYGVPVEHKQAPATKWDQPSADPLGDLAAWKNKIEQDTGVSPTDVLMSQDVIVALLKNEAITKLLAFNQLVEGGGATASEPALGKFVRERTGLNITKYIKGYTNDKSEFVPFVPKGTVVLMPSGTLGDTRMATTPEEFAFTDGKYGLRVVDGGVAISQNIDFDSVNIDTKVSMHALPSFDKADQVYISSVLTA